MPLSVTNLVGFGGKRAVAGGAGVSALTFEEITTGTGATLTIPSGASAGDVVVLVNRAYNNSSTEPTYTIPTGFSAIGDDLLSSGANRIKVVNSYKILDGGDPSATITGMAVDTANEMQLIRYSCDVAASSVTLQSFNAEGTPGDPAAQTILGASYSAPMIMVGSHAARTGFPSTALSVTADGTDLTGSLKTECLAYNSSPANVTWDANDVDLNLSISFLLEVA